MKRKIVLLAVAALLVGLSACGGNGSSENQNVEPNPTQAQEVIDSAESSVNESPNNAAVSSNAPDEYFTFGDTFVLWDTFEITLGNSPSFTVVERYNEYGVMTPSREQYAGTDVIVIPISITNISDSSARIFVGGSYSVSKPSGNSGDLRAHAASIFAFDNDVLLASDGVAPGETQDRLIHMFYEGDGGYTLTLGWRTVDPVHLHFPVVMP